jgi:hypothetical protein
MKISQKLPSEFDTTLNEYQHFVTEVHRRNKYEYYPHQISKADATTVFFFL